MKKTITFIIALVLAATALCGCNDKSDTNSSAGEEKVTTTSESKETQPESSSVTNSTDTSQPTVTEQPETSEESEVPDKPSVPDFEDEEVVKQLAWEAMNTIIYKDYDKYIELSNTDFLKQYYKDTGSDDEHFTEAFEEYSQEFKECTRKNWSDLILSDIEILESEIYKIEQYKTYYYTFTLNNGRYIEADLALITDGNEYSITIGDIETFGNDEETAIEYNSKAKIIYLQLYDFCSRAESESDRLQELTGSYYIGPDEVYDNEIMTEFVEYTEDYYIEDCEGLVYIEISPNGFPSLVQWTTRSEFRRAVGQYPNPSEIGDVDFLGSNPD